MRDPAAWAGDEYVYGVLLKSCAAFVSMTTLPLRCSVMRVGEATALSARCCGGEKGKDLTEAAVGAVGGGGGGLRWCASSQSPSTADIDLCLRSLVIECRYHPGNTNVPGSATLKHRERRGAWQRATTTGS